MAVAEDQALSRVVYEEEDYLFWEGDRRRFGRDDDVCEIPVWEEIRGVRLSKVAGELWCMDGELWVRNLSEKHELVVAGRTGLPQHLPLRRPQERGAACSVPVPTATISAPSTGSWTLHVQLLRVLEATDLTRGQGQQAPDRTGGPNAQGETLTVDSVPAKLRKVAAALCAPLLLHGSAAATYTQVAAVLDVSPRQARRAVEELCVYYRGRVPALLSAEARGDEPLYAAVARLLVNRGRIEREDVDGLDEADGADG